MAASAAFAELGQRFGWEPTVVAWMTDPDGLAATCLADFTHACTKEDDFDKIIDEINPPKKRLQLSRLRQAFQSLRDAQDKEKSSKRAAVAEDDLDAPLKRMNSTP